MMQVVFVAAASFAAAAATSAASSDPVLLRAAERLLDYCNFEPVAVAKDEAVPPVEGATLLQASLLLRHGDRSAIHSLPGSRRTRWPCNAPSTWETQWAATVLQPFRSTEECIASDTHPSCASSSSSSPSSSLPARVEHAIAAWRKAREEGEGCGAQGGELSSIGWQQLLEIGESQAKRYGPSLFLPDKTQAQEGEEAAGVSKRPPLKVISTDTGRTLLSATAFVRGLLNGVGLHAGKTPIEVQREQEEGLEEGERLHPEQESLYYSRQDARHYSARHADALILKKQQGGTDSAESEHVRLLLKQLGLELPLRLHVLPRPEDSMMAHARLPLCPLAMLHERKNSGKVKRWVETPEDVKARLANAIAGGAGGGKEEEEEKKRGRRTNNNDEDFSSDDDGSNKKAIIVASLIPGTESIADDLYTRLCHGERLPCWGSADGQGQNKEAATTAASTCEVPPSSVSSTSWLLSGNSDTSLSLKDRRVAAFLRSAAASSANGTCFPACDAATIMARGDDYYRSRYSQPSIKLMLYPLFRQILTQLQEAAAAGTKGATSPKMVIRTAHDVVLSPFLSAIGWLERPFAWSGYASRIAIELWQAAAPDPEGGQLLLRFLYNGRDITNKTSCAADSASLLCKQGKCNNNNSNGGGARWPCTLEGFEHLVTSLIAPAKNWEEACLGQTVPSYLASSLIQGKPVRAEAEAEAEAGAEAEKGGRRPMLEEEELAELSRMADEFRTRAGEVIGEATLHQHEKPAAGPGH